MFPYNPNCATWSGFNRRGQLKEVDLEDLVPLHFQKDDCRVGRSAFR
jgi:hypothetical protein